MHNHCKDLPKSELLPRPTADQLLKAYKYMKLERKLQKASKLLKVLNHGRND